MKIKYFSLLKNKHELLIRKEKMIKYIIYECF